MKRLPTFLIILGAPVLLASVAPSQQPEPPGGAPAAPAPAPESEDPRGWWDRLPPEAQERMRARWGAFRDLPPERQAELRRRVDTLRQERSFAWRWLDQEERQAMERRGEDERRRWLDDRVREHLRERVRSFEQRDPEFYQHWREMPPSERMKRGPRMLQEHHVERARAELERAVSEGWVGAAAAEWLRQAPADELMTAVGQVHRWRFLQRAEAEGFWLRHPLSADQRQHLLELPIPLFFEEIRRMEGGGWQGGPPHREEGGWQRPEGPHGLPPGPPHERRPEDRRDAESKRERHPPRDGR